MFLKEEDVPVIGFEKKLVNGKVEFSKIDNFNITSKMKRKRN